MNRKKLTHIRDTKITEFKEGDRCKVTALDTSNTKKLHILLSMGILPGKYVNILQIFPSYIFQVGQTQYAVDIDIANAIYVKSEDNDIK